MTAAEPERRTSGADPQGRFARFKAAPRKHRIAAAIVGLVAAAFLGVIAYLLAAAAFAIATWLGTIVLVGVICSLVGLLLLLDGILDTIVKRSINKRGPPGSRGSGR